MVDFTSSGLSGECGQFMSRPKSDFQRLCSATRQLPSRPRRRSAAPQLLLPFFNKRFGVHVVDWWLAVEDCALTQTPTNVRRSLVDGGASNLLVNQSGLNYCSAEHEVQHKF